MPIAQSPSLLYQILFITGSAAFLVLVYRLGVRQWEAKKTEPRIRRLGRPYYALIILTFSAGAIARTVQEATHSLFAEALVQLFLGMFMLALGWPILILWKSQPMSLARRILAVAITALIIFVALVSFAVAFDDLRTFLK